MTNTEIREEINKLNNSIREENKKNNYNFELNCNIKDCLAKIRELQEKCTHKNEYDLFDLNHGVCRYCGKIIENR